MVLLLSKKMRIGEFPIALLIFLFGQVSLEINEPETCEYATENKKFWRTYIQVFVSAKIISTNFISTPRYWNINCFSDNFLKQLHLNMHLEKPVLIRFYNSDEQSNLSFISAPNMITENSEQNPFISTRDYSGTQRETAELNFIVAWNVEMLNKFLDAEIKPLPLNSRTVYVFLFIQEKITEVQYVKIERLLQGIWSDNCVLNMIVEISYFDETQRMTFKFNPFYFENNRWGRMEVLRSWNFARNVFNFQGYPINVSIFPRKITAVKKIPAHLTEQPIYKNLHKSGGYGGLDGCVLAELANYLNFTAIFVTPSDQYLFGSKLENGTVTGTLADVVYKKADFSANGRFLMLYGTDEFEFTTTVGNDKLCVVVPKSDKIPEQLKIFRIFTVTSWLGILGIFVISLFVWTHFYPFWFEYDARKVGTVLEMVSVFLSAPILERSRSTSQNFFLCACLLFNVIFSGIFKGNLFTSHRITSYYPDINTLEELDRSGLFIMTTLPTLKDDSTELSRNLKKKIIPQHGDFKIVARQKNISILERMMDAKLYIEVMRIDYGGERMYHIVPDCLVSYYFSYIVPKGSPFLSAFDLKLKTFREAGLLDKWYYDTAEGILMDGHSQATEEGEKTVDHHPFSLGHLQVAFYILGIGLGLSVFVFIGEMRVWRKCVGEIQLEV